MIKGAGQSLELQNLRFSASFDDAPGRFLSSNFCLRELNGLPSTLISEDILVIGGLDDLSASVWVKSRGYRIFKGKPIADSAAQAVTDDAPSDIVAALSAVVAVDGGFDLSAAELDLTAQVETHDRRRFEPDPVAAALNWRGGVPLIAGKHGVALTEGTLDGLIEIGAIPLAQREKLHALSPSASIDDHDNGIDQCPH